MASCPVLPNRFLHLQRNTQDVSTHTPSQAWCDELTASAQAPPHLKRLPGGKVHLELECGLQVDELQAGRRGLS